jgi:hypothetical protein
MTLGKAVKQVKEEYERAKKLEFVHNPLAWALYRVWKEADKVEVKVEVKPEKTPAPKKVSQETLNALNRMGQRTHTAEE